MNDQPEPGPEASPTDELASALLDGEAAPGERARATEPEVAARLEAFGAVARLVGTPVEQVGARERESAIAAALAAFDTPAPGEVGTGSDELAARRARGRRTWRIASIAAAALVAIVGLGALVAAQDDGSHDTAAATARTAAGENDTAASGSATAGGAAPTIEANAGDAAPMFDTAATGYLGDFADVDDLVADMRAQGYDSPPPLASAMPAAPGADSAEATTAPVDPCPQDHPDAEVVEVLGATLEGRPIVVVVLRDPGRGAREAVAYEDGTCEVVARVIA